MIKSFLVVSAVCAQLFTPVAEQPGGAQTKTIGNWERSCAGPDNVCQLEQTLRPPSDPKHPVRVTVSRRGEGLRVLVQTPQFHSPELKITLNTGPSMTAKNPKCSNEACLYSFELTYEQAHKLKDASIAILSMPLGNGTEARTSVDIDDLWGALESLPLDI